MKKIFPKHTDSTEGFRKICDRAYIYERDKNDRLRERRASRIFVTHYRTEDEILDELWTMLGGITDENVQ